MRFVSEYNAMSAGQSRDDTARCSGGGFNRRPAETATGFKKKIKLVVPIQHRAHGASASSRGAYSNRKSKLATEEIELEPRVRVSQGWPGE